MASAKTGLLILDQCAAGPLNVPTIHSDASLWIGPMNNLPQSSLEEVARRLRALAAGLTQPADIAAVNKYADELEREAKAKRPKATKDKP